jgi:hypothetical protein
MSPRLSSRALAVCVAALALVCACTDADPLTELSEHGVALPATLKEAYPIALAEARSWQEDVQLVGLGGRFTVMDESGRSPNHTFFFYSPRRARLVFVHLIAGVPWLSAELHPSSPLVPFTDLAEIVDSDAAVGAARARAEEINALRPDSIPEPERFTALLVAIPVYPEPLPPPADTVAADTYAWRVDFLVKAFSDSLIGDAYQSQARFYLHPSIEDSVFDRIVVPDEPELWAYPAGFP